MGTSLLDDIKYQFHHGSMVNKLILVNIFVFIAMLVVRVILNIFGPEPYEVFVKNVGLVHDWRLMIRPWTFFSYMFAHAGIMHIVFNMIGLYVFGLAFMTYFKDKQLLSVYVLGGLAGAVSYIIFANVLPSWTFGEYMVGASASVTALLFAVTTMNPEYVIRLMFLGDVKIKYIAAAFVILDLISISTMHNTGGHVAHLGGGLMGYFYVRQLQLGSDISKPFMRVVDKIEGWFRDDMPQKRKSNLNVVSKQEPSTVFTRKKKESNINFPTTNSKNINSPEIQQRINLILDKIGESGYDSLSKEEKEFLFRFKE